MDIICDFSIGFDREIEDVSMYEPQSSEGVERFLQKIMEDDKIVIGERCEGSIEVDMKKRIIKIEYRWCSDVGEDWNDDVWNDESVKLSMDEYPIEL